MAAITMHTHTKRSREARLTLWRGEQNGLSFEKRFKGDTQVAQSVKNLPAMQETWVPSMGWEDLLEKGKATHSGILAWRIPMDRAAWQAAVNGVPKSWTQLSN